MKGKKLSNCPGKAKPAKASIKIKLLSRVIMKKEKAEPTPEEHLIS